MAFEPKVLECMSAYRKKTRRDKLTLMMPFILAAAASLALLLFTVLFRDYIIRSFPARSFFDPGYGTSVFLKFLAAAAMIPIVGFFGYNLYSSVRYANARFRYFLEQRASDFDRTAAGKFAEALDGAAIAAGIAPPALVVLDDPAANAMAFTSEGGGKAVGVTTGLLEAAIPVDQANGIMAHELAHLLIGENVKAPGLADIEFLPSGLLVAFGALSMLAVLVAPPRLGYILLELGGTIVVFLMLALIHRSQAFINRLLDAAHHHDDILADSLAAKMTMDPLALEAAVRNLTDLAASSDRVPGGAVLARYMFVTPPTAEGDYFRYSSQVAGQMLTGKKTPRTWALHREAINEAMRGLLESERRAGKERIINLDLINQGRWRALEDW